MLHWIQTTLHPERYHGYSARAYNTRAPFFEGWYYKLVDATAQQRYAIIPGVSLAPSDPHAFVQVLDGVTGETAYHRYPLTEFWAARHSFYVQIGPNLFTAARLKLDLPAPLALQGDLTFAGLQPWPTTFLAPGVMGGFAWAPRMECYHGILSLDHTLYGALRSGAREISFTEGRGYIEKDWGRAFPAAWVWMQSNHFATAGVSLSASLARIPWIGRAFNGFIVGLLHAGRLYRFTSYTGARIERADITPDHVAVMLSDRCHRLELSAERAAGGVLRGPDLTAMSLRVPETLSATVTVRLTDARAGAVIFEDVGQYAGMEIGGNTTLLTQR